MSDKPDWLDRWFRRGAWLLMLAGLAALAWIQRAEVRRDRQHYEALVREIQAHEVDAAQMRDILLEFTAAVRLEHTAIHASQARVERMLGTDGGPPGVAESR